MWRANRLKKIAESNRPVFESLTGQEWWLADVSTGKEPTPRLSAMARLKASLKPAPVAEITPALELAPVAVACAEKMEEAVQVASAPEPMQQTWVPLVDLGASGDARNSRHEELTWDAKRCCFVMSA